MIIKGDYIIIFLLLFLFFLQKTAQYQSKGYQHPQKHKIILQNDLNCQSFDRQNLKIYGKKEKHSSRLLQSAYQGNMRITTYIPDDQQDSILDGKYQYINLNGLRTVVGIAATYWQKIISVQQPDFIYSSTDLGLSYGDTCNSIIYPKDFLNNGIIGAKQDLVVFVDVYYASTTTIAAAGPCYMIAGRPMIGTIRYNRYQVAQYINLQLTSSDKQYFFYKAALVSVHQFTHILGLNSYFYLTAPNPTMFYGSFDSVTRKNQSQIITINGTQNGYKKYYFTSQKIKNYVANHFQCNTGIVGALLDAQSPGHWHRNVFKQELMNPFDRYRDGRMSKMTLLLIQLTGWYSNVDVGLGYDLDWGYQQGCDFLKGQNTNFDANPCPYPGSAYNQCDAANRYFGYCSATRETSVSGSTQSQNFCQLRQDQRNLDRCFEITNQNANCFEAYCSTDKSKIFVKADGINYQNCSSSTDIIQVNSVIIKCPRNFKLFCNQPFCQNLCDLQGFCIQGVCHYYNCPLKIPGCRFCSKPNRGQLICDSCYEGLIQSTTSNGSKVCKLPSSSINNCTISTYREIQNFSGPLYTIQVCLQCSNGFTLSLDSLSCIQDTVIPQPPNPTPQPLPPNQIICSEKILNCQTCQIDPLNLSNIFCLKCQNDFINSLDSKTCTNCIEVIPNCKTCQTDGNGNTKSKCLICLSNFVKLDNGNTCLLCSDSIQNCQQCINDNINGIQCQICQNKNNSYYLLSLDFKTCQLCQRLISNCQICQYNLEDQVVCQKCFDRFFISTNLKSCTQNISQCFIQIPNCQSCVLNQQTNQLYCQICKTGYQSFENDSQCKKCEQKIPHCSHCTINDTGKAVCSICNENFAPTDDLSECKVICQDFIPYCQVCHLNSSGQTLCDYCQENYYPSKDNHQCLKSCSLKIPNCRICGLDQKNNDICYSCLNGHGFKYSNTQCNSCQQNGLKNCLKCKNYSLQFKFWITDPIINYNVFLCNKCEPGHQWKFSYKKYSWYKTQCIPIF